MKYTLKETITGAKTPFLTTVDVEIIEDELVFDFYCKDSKFFSFSTVNNTEQYNGDVVEAFVCTGNDLSEYFEIEVAPNNTVFFKKIKNFGDYKITATEIENKVKSKVEIVGNDYKVKFSVPLDFIGYNPEIGIRFNAFRIETEGGITNKNLLALSPTKAPFYHKPECFIKL